MGYWEFIVPEATTNLVDNPSIEDAITGYTGVVGVEDIARHSAQSKFGAYSLYCETTANASPEGWDYPGTGTNGIPVSASTDYTFTAWVRTSYSTTQLQISWYTAAGAGISSDTQAITASAGDWVRHTLTAESPATAAYACLFILESAGSATPISFYTDAVQFEEKDHSTTYCDGDQEGCEWLGPVHASNSSRSAVSRAGGRVYDFEDDYSFSIIDWQGWGVPPHRLDLSPYKVLPGGALSGVKVESNVLTLVGYFQGSTLANLHALRQALVEELAHDRYPATDQGWQPIRIRYTGAAVTKEAQCFYDSGLEGSAMVGRGFTEQMPVRFLMADPFWYELGESSQVLDVNDNATLRYLGGRLKSTGQWDTMGLTLDPANANGESGEVYVVCAASDGSVYFAGQYEGLDNDGVGGGADAGCDFIARYDPEDDMFKVLVGAGDMPVGSTVRCIKEGPDGTIYIGGNFAAVNGDGTLDYIIAYDPDTDTWSDLDDPDSGGNMATVRDMAFDSSGNLWIVGGFTGVAGVANTEYVAYWDGTSWNSAGDVNTGTASITVIIAIAIDSQDNVYVGGTFTNLADDANADYWGWYNGTAWAAVDDIALNGSVYAMAINEQDELFVGGAFTDPDSVSAADYIFKWNGYAVEALGDSVNSANVLDIEISPDGMVWVLGGFTAAGSISVTDGIAIWNGSTWTGPDVNLTGTPDVNSVSFGPADPVVPNNYNVYIGYDASGTAYIAGDTTVTNGGTVAAYPVIHLKRVGNAGRLMSIRNWTTGHELFCDYALLDGEELIIDCRPLHKSITSTFFGNQPGAILPNSDFGAFYLQPGSNLITVFVDTASSTNVDVWAVWRDGYRGMD